MRIFAAESLALPEIKVIRFSRFSDHRGYFTEHYRKSDFQTNPLTPFLRDVEFTQMNESFSRRGTIRGLHFQWDPVMGKLVRILHGHMVDLVLDIRKGSPMFGKIIAHDMPSHLGEDKDEWIWIPPGFAHGIFFLEDSLIEYLCTGEYHPGCEAGISPFANDIDWSLCNPRFRDFILQVGSGTPLITAKDKHGYTLEAWAKDDRSNHFVYDPADPPLEISFESLHPHTKRVRDSSFVP